MNRLVSYFASIANSGLNLVLVLAVARVTPTDAFADFTAGMVYGGPFAVLIAFGNDTILAKAQRDRPGFARLVSIARIAMFTPMLAIIATAHSINAAAGLTLVAAAALQQRFYFEALNKQMVVNGIGILEKVACVVGVFIWSQFFDAADTSSLFLWIVLVKTTAGALISAQIIAADKGPLGGSVFLDSVGLCIGALPFAFGYAATQSPALVLVDSASAIHVADFGIASQVGAGLAAALTLWQRPAVHRYIENEVSIRRELMLSIALALTAGLVVYFGMHEYGGQFKLLPERSVIYGYVLLALVTAVLHPFEIRGYANGKIGSRGLVYAAVSVLIVAIPLSLIIGFWAVPLAAIQYQVAVFAYHKLWLVRVTPAA